MSRKTRKLMWSVPLIATVAVIGALAAYVMLAPGGALAHSGDSVSTAHQPPGPVTKIDVTTPSIADGGRTSLRVTWNAPTGDDATMYRVDVSKDTDVWMNVIGGEMSDDMLTDADAMADCTSDDNRNRCYTAPGLDSDTLYHFRVFAMNEFGTSPISVDDTLGSGMTLRIDPPARVGNLDATDYYEDKIVVSWHDVLETGGADVLWYCIGVAASPSGSFIDLANPDNEDEMTACRDAVEATPAAMADDEGVYASPVGVDISTLITAAPDVSQTIVVAAKDEDGDAVVAYEHLGLHTPDVIELRYRLYAVTDEEGDAETVGDRQISRAASETATGRTLRPSDKPDPRFEAPPAVGNLRAVVYTNALTGAGDLPDPSDTNQDLHFFWTHPEGYNPDYNDDENLNDPNWYVQVQRRVADDAEHDKYPGWQFVTGTTPGFADTDGLATGYGAPQFTVNFAATLDDSNDPPQEWAAPVLWGNSKDNKHEYRVRYVNPGLDEDTDEDGHQNEDRSDDVSGAWEEIRIPQVTTKYLRSAADGVPDAASTLPIILLSTDNTGSGLRFEYNDDDPRDHIDLLWTRDANAREGEDGPNGPHGYVIDRSADEGATWQSLARADTPNDLGTADTFTDSPGGDHKVVPGNQYTYRVFPVFIEEGPDAYGVPALIDANSRGADLPTAARSVDADGDGQNACVVTWRAPADSGGHPVRGYLIQMASDDDGEPGAWEPINIDVGIPPFTVMGGAMTEFKYTGTVAQLGSGKADELSAGAVRWFRVIPVTNENDGNQATGGAVLDEEGDPNDPRNSRDEDLVSDLPLDDDAERAVPDKCTTEGLGDAPADRVTADPQMPVDLTVEAASDTNSLDPNDRGVFLTWNQQPTGDASKTTSYRINRIRMNTGVEALNDEADDWQFVKRVSDVTSYTDSTDLRRDEETRMYQVCSEASGVADPACVEMPVTYALHGAHEPDAPTGVMAESSADGTMVTVSWTAPGSNGGSDITGYKVMYKMTGSDADYMSMDAAADATSATISDLTAGTGYDIVVVAVNAVGESAMATAMGMTHDVPGAPTGVTAESSANGTMLTVSWTAPASDGGSDITGYKVMYKMTGSDADYMSMDAAADATSATISDLTAGTGYDIVVVAVNAVGESAMATAMGMTHDVPGAPTGVMVVSSAAGTMATVSWTAPASDGGSDITGYKVMYKMTGSDADYMSMDAAADATSATISDLTAGTGYDIVVVAVNAVGESAMVTAMGMTHDVPGAPTGVTAESSANGTMLTVSWTAPASDGGSDITGYKVMYKMTGSDADYMSMDAAADATSATISDLTAGTGYDIVVVAVNAVGESAMATAMGMTHDVPGAPTGVMVVSSAAGTMATVSWTAPASDGGSAITGYKVMYKMTGSDADYMSMDAAADATSATISDLTAGTGYDIVVVAVNAVGESAMATAMGMTHDVPGAPTGVMVVSSAAGTMATVSWTAPASDGGSAITGYKVMYKMTGSDADYMSMEAAADATSATISDLTPNTGYDIVVVAVNAVGYSNMGMAMGMTDDIAPNAPSGVSAMADDMEGRTTINVSWMAPADNGGSAVTGYTLQRAYMMADDTMSEWMDVDPAHMGMDLMYMDTGLMPGTTYYYRVLAMNAVGNSEWSDGMAMATTEEAADTTLGDAMGLTAGPTDDNDPAAIKLTWDAGANATTHTVVGVLKNADGTFDTSTAIWLTEVTSPLKVEMGARTAGTYIFGVIAGQIDGDDREWSDWARVTVEYQQ